MMAAHLFIRGDIHRFGCALIRMAQVHIIPVYYMKPEHELYAIQSRRWSYDELAPDCVDFLVSSAGILKTFAPNVLASFSEWFPIKLLRVYLNTDDAMREMACELVVQCPRRFSDLCKYVGEEYKTIPDTWYAWCSDSERTELAAHCAALYSEWDPRGQSRAHSAMSLSTLKTVTKKHGLFLKYCNDACCDKLYSGIYEERRFHGYCSHHRDMALEALDATMCEVTKCAWPRHISELVMDIAASSANEPRYHGWWEI